MVLNARTLLLLQVAGQTKGATSPFKHINDVAVAELNTVVSGAPPPASTIDFARCWELLQIISTSSPAGFTSIGSAADTELTAIANA